ncbi:hypothetical protein PMAYCL1PPCAC_27810 [Pristionchus mayeri]|uniref:Uncharacterized protein n=1 Tax=Pristionchus mayeri TaxID=1317129 RepID=A0AAN5IB15_9BILA|nr:hypothetical protein PMAYCL1PPCAC_27810 [Pristionchus mayeri]
MTRLGRQLDTSEVDHLSLVSLEVVVDSLGGVEHEGLSQQRRLRVVDRRRLRREEFIEFILLVLRCLHFLFLLLYLRDGRFSERLAVHADHVLADLVGEANGGEDCTLGRESAHREHRHEAAHRDVAQHTLGMGCSVELHALGRLVDAHRLDVQILADAADGISEHLAQLLSIGIRELVEDECLCLHSLAGRPRQRLGVRGSGRGEGNEQLLEWLSSSDEIGLAAQLDDCSEGPVDLDAHQTLGGRARRESAGLLPSLLPRKFVEPLDCLVQLRAIELLQGLEYFDEGVARALTEFLQRLNVDLWLGGGRRSSCREESAAGGDARPSSEDGAKHFRTRIVE